MAYIDFISLVHKSTPRDYLARVTEYPKAEAAKKAKQWDRDYWDGDRKTGYGGMRYDGRWRKVARAMIDHYGLQAGDRVLDIGCGKGYLLHDFAFELPGLEVAGLDISAYAIKHAKEEIADKLTVGDARELPYGGGSFDLVVSIATLHNLPPEGLVPALKEIERVGRRRKFVCVESYRTEEEKANLLYWQLTCETFARPETWDWYFELAGYTGDYCFITFE